MKIYTNCPACGGLTYYTGENFKRAEVLISAENEHLKNEINYLQSSLDLVLEMLDKKIEFLSSEQLNSMYQRKHQIEMIKEQEERDKIYRNIHEEQQKAWNNFLENSLK